MVVAYTSLAQTSWTVFTIGRASLPIDNKHTKAAHDTSWSRYGPLRYHQCPERRPITTDASATRHCPHNPPPCSAQEAHTPHFITRGMQGLLLIGSGCSQNIRIAALRAARHADITSEKACFASTTRPGSASGCARQCFSRHLSWL